MIRQDVRAPVGIDAVIWTLRIGAFMCFVGHGAFGIITKAGWVPYFAVAGIGRDAAYTLMPVIGAFDVVMGCLILLTPRPAIVCWMIGWAVWTAALRPLSGEPVWEALERAGNYGTPAALLIFLTAPTSRRDALRPALARTMTRERLTLARRQLTCVVALLLIGHGALGVIGKAGLVHNYQSVVSASTAASVTPLLGWFEILLAMTVIFWQPPLLLGAVAGWKMVTEALFVTAGAPAWEWIERGGSYASPIALAVIVTILNTRDGPASRNNSVMTGTHT